MIKTNGVKEMIKKPCDWFKELSTPVAELKEETRFISNRDKVVGIVPSVEKKEVIKNKIK